MDLVDDAGADRGGCVVVADRWTADYGPTHVTAYAVAAQPAVWTTVRCTVTKNGTTYVDTSATDYDSDATIVNQRRHDPRRRHPGLRGRRAPVRVELRERLAGYGFRSVQPRSDDHRCCAAAAAAPDSGTGTPPRISAGAHA